MQVRKIARERLEKGELENEQDHVCVLNSVARSIIKRCGGKHPPRYSPGAASHFTAINSTARLNARL